MKLSLSITSNIILLGISIILIIINCKAQLIIKSSNKKINPPTYPFKFLFLCHLFMSLLLENKILTLETLIDKQLGSL